MNERTETTEVPPEAAAMPGTATTREHVLDIAEKLFAERGLDAVSIRDITGVAEVNLGAINYHFGTKENLVQAVVERRIAPLAEQRLRALEAALREAGDKPLKLETVLDALFRPAIEQATQGKAGGVTFRRLLARCFVEANPVVEQVILRHFEPMRHQFDAALLNSMPGLTKEDVCWRMHLLIGALHQSLMLFDRPPLGGPPLKMDTQTYLKRFLEFAVAGFKAGVPSPKKKGRNHC